MKAKIEDRYIRKEEIRTNKSPYLEYYNMLIHSFDGLNDIGSICDVGCANGILLDIIHDNHPDKSLCGIEYFYWHRESAAETIRKYIVIADLRDPLNTDVYDLVNCTEVGEHIDPDYTGIFLSNIRSMTGKYLLISWSSHGGINDRKNDPHLQHLNPLLYSEFISLLENNGFAVDEYLTTRVRNRFSCKQNFYFWWKESLTVFKLDSQ